MLLRLLNRAVLLGLLVLAGPAWAQDYAGQVAQWASYKDVAAWLDDNFVFDKARLDQVQGRVRESGPNGLLARNPASTFALKQGYCTDAASFAIDALNRINPEYKAGWVFIKNGAGPPHHWVAGFQADGKTYIMDYGPGPEWRQMRGVHGPYESLDEYKAFLSGLNLRRFFPERVEWREMPGAQD